MYQDYVSALFQGWTVTLWCLRTCLNWKIMTSKYPRSTGEMSWVGACTPVSHNIMATFCFFCYQNSPDLSTRDAWRCAVVSRTKTYLANRLNWDLRNCEVKSTPWTSCVPQSIPEQFSFVAGPIILLERDPCYQGMPFPWKNGHGLQQCLQCQWYVWK